MILVHAEVGKNINNAMENSKIVDWYDGKNLISIC